MSIFTKDILMGNLQVIFSNRIEKLVDVFADKMRVPVCGDDFLTPETVLLDNKVLGQWLNMQLAEKHGVAANIDYIQPSRFKNGHIWTLPPCQPKNHKTCAISGLNALFQAKPAIQQCQRDRMLFPNRHCSITCVIVYGVLR